jgi:uncharacterized protein (TIGR04255 family)
MNIYPILNNSPIVVALVQIKFKAPLFSLESVLTYDTLLKHEFPVRHNNIQVGIDLGKTTIPLGESKVSGTSNAEIGSYVYLSKNQKEKLEISSDTLTYIDENPYQDWETFKSKILKKVDILSPLFESAELYRISVRFVNRFTFEDFTNPKKYFNALITSVDGQASYPLHQYGFRLTMDVPDSDIYTIVNHNVENVSQNKYIYTFDIDVLDRQNLIFDLDTISETLENLRNIKNKIFFETITETTLQLCNCQK